MERMSTETGSTYLNFHLLKKLREERCWSQSKLANVCFKNGLSVSLSSVKRAETGKKVLYRTALDLATVFQISVNDLRKVDVKIKTKPSRVDKRENVMILETSSV